MKNINLFNTDYQGVIKSVKNVIASAKSKNNERHFVWAISVIDEYFPVDIRMLKFHPNDYKKLMSKIYETIGDSYFGIKKYDLAFSCYVASYQFKKTLVLNKILYTTKINGNHLSRDNAFLGFLFLLSANNNFPGRHYNNVEFLKKISLLTSSMSLDIQLYADLYIALQSNEGSVFENLDRQQELFNSANIKYGSEKANSVLQILYSGVTNELIASLLENSLASAYENFISSDVLKNSNRNIFDELHDVPNEIKLKRMKCSEEHFWRNVDPKILYRTLNEDINFAFKYISFINSLFGHPAIIRELQRKVALHSSDSLKLNEKRFDLLFEHPFNLDKVRAIYRKLPIS